MNKLHHSKSKKQLHTEKVIKRIAVIFITGAICGAGLTTLIHKCEAATIPNRQSLGTFKITAYCACKKCCGKTNGITASGVKAREGITVAADTRKLPFGTNLYIDGVGERTVQDRGGAIKGNKIDIFFNSHQQALKFGVQYKEVFIIKKG